MGFAWGLNGHPRQPSPKQNPEGSIPHKYVKEWFGLFLVLLAVVLHTFGVQVHTPGSLWVFHAGASLAAHGCRSCFRPLSARSSRGRMRTTISDTPAYPNELLPMFRVKPKNLDPT